MSTAQIRQIGRVFTKSYAIIAYTFTQTKFNNGEYTARWYCHIPTVFRNLNKELESHSLLIVEMRMPEMTGLQTVPKIVKIRAYIHGTLMTAIDSETIPPLTVNEANNHEIRCNHSETILCWRHL
jgi:hypothetical protein